MVTEAGAVTEYTPEAISTDLCDWLALSVEMISELRAHHAAIAVHKLIDTALQALL